MKTIRYRMLKFVRVPQASGAVVEYDEGRFYRLRADRAAAFLADGTCEPEADPADQPEPQTHAPESPGAIFAEALAGTQDETEETRAESDSDPDDEDEEEEE